MIAHRFTGAIALALACVLLVIASPAESLLKAFPTAEGFGATTPGGRGGKVLLVTTLEDYLPGKEQRIEGSLRAAVETEGPRTLVFRVGGTIALKADLWITKPFITIAGQSAPGGGICIRDYQIVLGTNDVILRHLRIRSGDVTRKEQMSLGIFGGNNSIVDHCSMSWAIDEVMSSFGNVHNLTVQWSLIAEGLSKSYHPKGEHSKGSILQGDGGVSIHHSVYAHNSARNTRIDNMLLDFRNNVVYNWGYRCGYTHSGPIFVNYINNVFKPGPSTRKSAIERVFVPGDDIARMHFAGNLHLGQPEANMNNALLLYPDKGYDAALLRETVLVQAPFLAPQVATDQTDAVLARVLADAGATKPARDSADARLMHEIETGTGRIIDSQDDVGGWPVLDAGVPAEDADLDGMADEWERANSLNPGDATDNIADADTDGYTNIEELLNATDPRTPEVDCAVDKAEFTSIQQQALELSAAGRRAQLARSNAAVAAKEAQVESIKQSLNVTISPPSLIEGREYIEVALGGKSKLHLVRIAAGKFLMGSPESEGGLDNERPQHEVTISRPFYMAVVPTTTAQYCAVLGEDARELTEKTQDLPAKEVSWFEAVEYCEILSEITGAKFRLPTEAEWEYACRAGTTTAFYTGETIASTQANFNALEASQLNPAGDFHSRIMPVQTYPPNPWGLFDMPGNEAEWCRDICYRKYTTKAEIDPVNDGPDGARVLRGGKSGSKAFYVRSASRYGYTPHVGYSFRIVMEAP